MFNSVETAQKMHQIKSSVLTMTRASLLAMWEYISERISVTENANIPSQVYLWNVSKVLHLLGNKILYHANTWWENKSCDNLFFLG